MSVTSETRQRSKSSVKKAEKDQEHEKASESKNFSKQNAKAEPKKKHYSLIESNTRA